MKPDLKNKPGAEPGWAQIILEFDEGEPDAPQAGEHFELAIQEKPSDKFFQDNGPNHWPEEGSSECYFAPHAQSFDGHVLTLELGPPVTGTLKAQQYVFHIRGSQGYQYTYPKSIVNLRRPKTGRLDLEVGAGPAQTLPPVEPKPTEPEPTEPPVESERTEPEPSGPPPAEPSLTPPKLKKRLALWLGLSILILGLAGAGFWFWKRAGKFSLPAPPPPAADGQAEPAAPGSAGSLPPLEEARELLRRGAATAELEAALARLEDRPGAEDAVFLLAKALAPRAAKHRVRYAAFMDPADARPSGSIKKDPLAAYEEYEAAKSAGAPGAAEALERLRQWAEERAAQGDPEAARLRQLYGGNQP